MGALFRILDCLQHLCLPVHLSHPAASRISSSEPDAFLDAPGAHERDADDAGSGVQHGDQFHDEHELAIVLAGYDAWISRPDGGTRRSKLRFRGRGYCGGCSVDAWICLSYGEHHRQFLGGYDASYSLRPAADFHRGRSVLRMAGFDSEFQGPGHGSDP